jgi:hypothetical protein
MSADMLQYALLAALAGGLLWLSARIGPHWASRDGNRFMCRGRTIDDDGQATGSWRDYRVFVTPAGQVRTQARSLLGARGSGLWTVADRDDGPNEWAFVLHSNDTAGRMLEVRVPTSSSALGALTALAGVSAPTVDDRARRGDAA